MMTVEVIYRNGKLDKILANEQSIEIDVIREKSMEEWFEEIDDRSGWNGLVEEAIYTAGNIDNEIGFILREEPKDENKVEELKEKFYSIVEKLGYKVINNETEFNKEKIEENKEKLERAEELNRNDEVDSIVEENANRGDVDSKVKLGNKCRENGDWEKAFQLYEQAAEQGNAEAQYWIGVLLRDEDIQKSVEYFEKSAENRYPNGEYELAQCYYNGTGKNQNKEVAFQWYEKAAEQGNAASQYILGTFYLNGEIVDKNIKMVKKYYKAAAYNGSAEAQFSLAKCYEYGDMFDKNIEKAIELYQKAADKNNIKACCKMGDCYYYGFYGVEESKNYVLALDYYNRASEMSKTKVKLADCLFSGKGCEKNIDKSIEYLSQVNEAELTIKEKREFGELMCNVGCLYFDTNKTEALKWLERAANNGIAKAQHKLGIYFESIYEYDKAFEWYKKASNNGYFQSTNKLGDYYFKGISIKENRKKAYNLYTQVEKCSADNKEKFYATYMKAKCNYYGYGVKQDIYTAVSMFKYLDENINTYGDMLEKKDKVFLSYILGDCYFNGNGIEENVEKAFRYLNKIESEIHLLKIEEKIKANYALASFYANGKFTRLDEYKAFSLYKKIADCGKCNNLVQVRDAKYKVAYFYENGKGTGKNIEKAAEYYRKAEE